MCLVYLFYLFLFYLLGQPVVTVGQGDAAQQYDGRADQYVNHRLLAVQGDVTEKEEICE